MGHYTSEDYQTFIRQHLDARSPLLVEQLRAIVRQRFHPRVSQLRIEVLPGGLMGQLPLTIFMLDAANFHVLHNGDAFPLRLLEEVEHIIPLAEAEWIRQYDEAGVETIEVELQTLIAWVAACWIEAGGHKFSLAALIGIRGDIESFDLKEGCWVLSTSPV